MILIIKWMFIFLGVLICSVSGFGIYSQKKLINLIKMIWEKKWSLYTAIIISLILGIGLIIIAPESKFYIAFLIFGGLTILRAIILVIIGKDQILKIINKFENLSPLFYRLWLSVAIAFGIFLIYGVL